MHIKEIELLTNNIDETINFYATVLGFKTVQAGKEKVSFKTGESLLTFLNGKELQPRYHFAFNIPCNKTEQAVAWLSAITKPIAIEGNTVIADFRSWNAKAVYFPDNNGNILEFIARFDLDNASSAPFNATSVESVSEIGLVTDEPLLLAETLVKEKGFYYFSKGTVSENFITLGDDNGLFIISKTNRLWYPTNTPAKKYFTRVKMELNGHVFDLKFN